ncbi:MAG: oxidoreductase [Myxococcota bacterium]
MKWTWSDMPSQQGRVVVVTGANSGLGLESARAFARKGARVVMACRSEERGGLAREDILGSAPQADVALMLLDLADLQSVRRFAQEFAQRYDKLDILMNNAGLMALPKRFTADGFEMQLGVNHFGHYALTGLLLGHLKATAGSRVVNVSSLAANQGTMHFEDLTLGDGYRPFTAYGQSKLANLLFTLEFKRRAEAAGAKVRSIAAHPGGSNTNLGDHMEVPRVVRAIGEFVLTNLMQTAAKGALSQLYASASEDAVDGGFYGPDGLGGIWGYPGEAPYPHAAKDVASAQRLWSISEERTGVRYNFEG